MEHGCEQWDTTGTRTWPCWRNCCLDRKLEFSYSRLDCWYFLNKAINVCCHPTSGPGWPVSVGFLCPASSITRKSYKRQNTILVFLWDVGQFPRLVLRNINGRNGSHSVFIPKVIVYQVIFKEFRIWRMKPESNWLACSSLFAFDFSGYSFNPCFTVRRYKGKFSNLLGMVPASNDAVT